MSLVPHHAQPKKNYILDFVEIRTGQTVFRRTVNCRIVGYQRINHGTKYQKEHTDKDIHQIKNNKTHQYK